VISLGNVESSKKIGIDHMTGMGFREAGLPVDSLDAHLSHEGSYMGSAYLVTPHSQYVSHAPGAEVGLFEMNLVDDAHEFPVGIADRYRRIVKA